MDEAQAAIDLTRLEDIPDVDVPPAPLDPGSVTIEDEENLSEEECLALVMSVLSDISAEYALSQIQSNMNETRTHSACGRLIARILDEGAYPKEQDTSNQRKRKRDDDEFAEFQDGDQVENVPGYRHHALELLKDEFLQVPVRHIENTLNDEKSLFKSFVKIESQLQLYNNISMTFSRIANPRKRRHHERTLTPATHLMLRELAAARNWGDHELAKRLAEVEASRIEEENLMMAQANGEMSECQCCFDDFPTNRMTFCSGESIHFICKTCAGRAVEEEMSQGRCRPKCIADTACVGTYSRAQLQDFLLPKSFERLEKMQQQADIAAAGLADLEECPFCDFKAECPPVEIDKEFRCQNTECRKVSCRLCQKETHIPKSCEEAKKDANITVRHQVEEAMSEALIRKCNRCKNPFVKDHGCNKMTCTKCSNVQCYVCSKDVRDYNHFSDEGGRSKCPLHDNVELRHEEEVKKAEAEAFARVRAENPEISENELKIQVSERVTKAEDARRGQAQANHAAFPYHMQGNVLMPGPIVEQQAPAYRVNPLVQAGNALAQAGNALVGAFPPINIPQPAGLQVWGIPRGLAGGAPPPPPPPVPARQIQEQYVQPPIRPVRQTPGRIRPNPQH
ncbi:hypothetical protein BDV96DRAFT_484706 [Lophiotrema nucula]|uniref:RING-type domain-containing protein n=1 Tax=Lophiotrema nucula TaxID=690887 RepID=A0A6A5ZRK9_9PLEO|nr:hypothetical protein BDV96DRAFT_484706 [Lophiotrema nucula]